MAAGLSGDAGKLILQRSDGTAGLLPVLGAADLYVSFGHYSGVGAFPIRWKCRALRLASVFGGRWGRVLPHAFAAGHHSGSGGSLPARGFVLQRLASDIRICIDSHAVPPFLDP